MPYHLGMLGFAHGLPWAVVATVMALKSRLLIVFFDPAWALSFDFLPNVLAKVPPLSLKAAACKVGLSARRAELCEAI